MRIMWPVLQTGQSFSSDAREVLTEHAPSHEIRFFGLLGELGGFA